MAIKVPINSVLLFLCSAIFEFYIGCKWTFFTCKSDRNVKKFVKLISLLKKKIWCFCNIHVLHICKLEYWFRIFVRISVWHADFNQIWIYNLRCKNVNCIFLCILSITKQTSPSSFGVNNSYNGLSRQLMQV